MKLVKRKPQYNPFYELEQIHNELSSIFDWPFSGFLSRGLSARDTHWAPAIDVADKKDVVVVKADLPGIEKEDVKVVVQDNTLVIHGERKIDKEIKEDGYVRTERNYGAFHRALALPADVDAGKATAQYKNGTLTLTLPKKEEAKAKQIDIDVK